MRLGTAVAALVRGGLWQKAKVNSAMGWAFFGSEPRRAPGWCSVVGSPSLQDPEEPPWTCKGSAVCVWKRVAQGPGSALGQSWDFRHRKRIGGPSYCMPWESASVLCAHMSAKTLLITGISRALLLGPGCSHVPEVLN